MEQDLDHFLAARMKTKKTLTLVTGVFDLLHEEHRNFLLKAKPLADLLLVGLESDVRVKQLKGDDRPINKQSQRLANLRAWGIADYIFILPENFSKPAEHRRLIEYIRPNFMAVSSHTAFASEKEAILADFGAKLVVVHEFNPKFSSSRIIKNFHK
jgi:D-beta-D-heptose 7-phosphate kinase/D-beta-D-heptose 1-phosphate adenosyltransferase